MHRDAKNVGTVELEPTSRTSKLSPVRVNDHFLLVKSFLLLIVRLRLLEVIDQMNNPERYVQTNGLDRAFP